LSPRPRPYRAASHPFISLATMSVSSLPDRWSARYSRTAMPRLEHRNRFDLLGRQVVPHQSVWPALARALDHLVRRDDQIHAEVVLGLRDLLVDDLELMDWRNDDRPVRHQARLDEQRD